MLLKSIITDETIEISDYLQHNTKDKYYSYYYVENLNPQETQILETTLLWEWNTPLIKSKNHQNLFLKNEWTNPTGSFKDRESSFVLRMLNLYNNNWKEYLLNSSWNAAISALLYANYFDKKIRIFVSRNVWNHKLDILRHLWADVEIFWDDYEETYRYVIDKIIKNNEFINITAWYLEWRDEANKMISYELQKQLNWKQIDYVIIPIWNWWLYWWVYKWFKELYEKWEIKKMPYLIWVQVTNASPIEISVNKKTDYHCIPKEYLVDSIADWIVARESYCSPKVMKIINSWLWRIITVNESEIKKWYDIFLKEWLLVEHTSAVVYSAYNKLKEELGDQTVVAIISWNGQKML